MGDALACILTHMQGHMPTHAHTRTHKSTRVYMHTQRFMEGPVFCFCSAFLTVLFASP